MPSVPASPIRTLSQIPVHPFRIPSIISLIEARRSSHVLILPRLRMVESPVFRRQCRGILKIIMLALLTAAALVISHIGLFLQSTNGMM